MNFMLTIFIALCNCVEFICEAISGIENSPAEPLPDPDTLWVETYYGYASEAFERRDF